MIAVYGAGVIARRFIDLLIQNGILLDIVIVSDRDDSTPNMIEGIKVLTIDEAISKEPIPDKLYIATDEKYWAQIRKTIHEKASAYEKSEILWVENEYILELKRKAHPVNTENFLKQSEPVSKVFGLDRGTPIDRYYIEQFIDVQSKKIGYLQRILEVGEDTYSRRFFRSDTIQYDILDHLSGMDLTMPKTLPASNYDVFICTQVFNFIYDVRAAIKGAYYVLKPGGVLIATVAGNISQVSSYDRDRWGDYWRFTSLGIKLLIDETFGSSEIISYGNAMAATSFVQGMAFEEVNREILDIKDDNYSILIGIFARK